MRRLQRPGLMLLYIQKSANIWVMERLELGRSRSLATAAWIRKPQLPQFLPSSLRCYTTRTICQGSSSRSVFHLLTFHADDDKLTMCKGEAAGRWGKDSMLIAPPPGLLLLSDETACRCRPSRWGNDKRLRSFSSTFPEGQGMKNSTTVPAVALPPPPQLLHL